MLYNNLSFKFVVWSLLLISCSPKAPSGNANSIANVSQEKQQAKEVKKEKRLNREDSTIQTRFPTPDSFLRTDVPDNSFAHYLRNLPLKPHGSKVHYYNGGVKDVDDVYVAVVDMDVGDRDLQQCADAVMRLRAEFLYGKKKYEDIHFDFTNGFEVEYDKWRKGYRIRVEGNKTSWYWADKASDSYREFRKYMNIIFSYAGTLSLSKELRRAELADMQIGDVFIQGGSPGHAVIVVDMCEHSETGEKLFLLAQSYMPAQEIQVLQNPGDPNLSPWYSVNIGKVLHTPEWVFDTSDLKRW